MLSAAPFHVVKGLFFYCPILTDGNQNQLFDHKFNRHVLPVQFCDSVTIIYSTTVTKTGLERHKCHKRQA